MLHILKSPLNLKHAQSYKVCYIALSILRTKTKLNEWRLVLYRERVRLMCFTCWLRSGFSHFINMDSLSFTWYLVAAESRISNNLVCRMLYKTLNPVADLINLSHPKFEFDAAHLKYGVWTRPLKHVNLVKTLADFGPPSFSMFMLTRPGLFKRWIALSSG